jgi:hypothetical protein
MTNIRATKHQQNDRKYWFIHEDRRWTIHELADTVGISYGVCQGILTENLNMRRIAAKFCSPTLHKWSKAAARKRVSWATKGGYQGPKFYLYDHNGRRKLDSFPRLKMKLKGRRFETVSDIQRESQAVLDSIKESDFPGAFEAWKKRRDRCIRSPGRLVWRRWQLKLSTLSQHFFFGIVRELSDTPRIKGMWWERGLFFF